MRRAGRAAVLGPALGAMLAAALSLAAAPAHALFEDDVARARVEELRKRLDETARLVEERLGRLEDRRALIELASQIEALRGEIARLRGQVEVMQNQLDTADKRGKDLYVDIDTRLRKLEQPKEAAAEKPPAEAGPPAAEVKAYEAALNQFKLGNYPLAISAFHGLLVTYPQSRFAPSAQFWIGNAHSAQRDHKQAIAAWQKVLSAWPEDGKAPDAMLNIASSQEALGERRNAQRTLEGLLAKYPASVAAASAKQRLKR
ncbi:MAG: tol-pal system protein YbgF [Betaproteobacteria bacterium]|nr:tol-pal system protein YbgF [Betaproteobacteria bacterium]